MSAQQVAPVTKLWGFTRCVHRDRTHEIHHATIQSGGYSSRHHHERKDNLFYVVSGLLHVHRYDPDEPVALLGPGDKFTVAAGRDHRFVAQTDVQLVEVYWADGSGDLDPDDIVRVDVGGLAR